MVLLRLHLVAEKGFEPHDLRVMSPTSYQTAPLRDIMVPEAGVEPVREKISRDFKSRASANSAIPAWTTLWSSTLPIYYITKKCKSQYLFQKNFQKSKKLFDNLLTWMKKCGIMYRYFEKTISKLKLICYTARIFLFYRIYLRLPLTSKPDATYYGIRSKSIN